MSNLSQQAITARQLLNRQSVGVLSTHSVDVNGYPFGSITPYMFDYEGQPILLMAGIAQHTRNINRNNKVSLTVFDIGALDSQASGRVTWIGDAEPVESPDTEIHDRYVRYFPSSKTYFATHDFSFYRIRLHRARFIGGFGKIFWIEPNEMLLNNPFRSTERGIVEHMNVDHKETLLHYCNTLAAIEAADVAMTGIDSEGFDLLADERKVRINFESPIQTPQEARDALVKLAHQKTEAKVLVQSA